MLYFVKTPGWLKKVYSECVWNLPSDEKKLYLTFDDGPHPEETFFVLEELAKFNAKATFFCIGKNVVEHPHIYKRIMQEGHATGNHTFNHLNGWKTQDEEYFSNIIEARKYIDSNLFRPPYGRATKFQMKHLMNSALKMKIVMWSVLSGDFDSNISTEKCLLNVIKNTKSGDIIIFHDSAKASVKIRYALPKVLQHFSEQNYEFEKIIV
jgi:peptidoglycan/xylan/chitin deacetylase (PgdA/CDA1 family)